MQADPLAVHRTPPARERDHVIVVLDADDACAVEDQGPSGEPRLVGSPPLLLDDRHALAVVGDGDLELLVARQVAGVLVVDRQPRPAEASTCRVILGQEQPRIGLVGLQHDAHRDLVERAAQQVHRPVAAKGLGAEDGVQAEGSPLANQVVEELGALVGDGVVVREEHLELVHDHDHPGQRLPRVLPVGPDVVRPTAVLAAEQRAAAVDLVAETSEHGQTELPFALHRHDLGVREREIGVGAELHALLEVEQVQLQLGRGVPPRGRRDESVHQRRLARPGQAADQDVLPKSPPQRQVQ